MAEFSEAQAKAARLLVQSALQFLPEYGQQATDTEIMVAKIQLEQAMLRLPE